MFKVVAFIVTQKGQVTELRFAKNEKDKAIAVARDSSKGGKKVTLSVVFDDGKVRALRGYWDGTEVPPYWFK